MSDITPPTTRLEIIAASQFRALQWAAVFAFIAIVYVLEPLAIGILLGALFAFMTQPVFSRLSKRFGATGGALLTVSLTTILVVATLVGSGWLLGSRGVVHARQLVDSLGPSSPNGGVMTSLGKYTSYAGIAPTDLGEKLRAIAESGLAKIAAASAAILSVTATGLLVLFFMMLTMHFVLRNASSVIRLTAELLPLKPAWTMDLFSEFRRVGKTTLFGTIATGVIQGGLATLGYLLTGVDDPIFFGVATAVASLVPAVGTLLVWVPVGIVMIFQDHPIAGIIELVWGGLVVVGVSDYVIRPRLIGSESELPSLLTFAALFGGVEVFGLKGLIVGPLVMSLAFAVLRLYSLEAKHVTPLVLTSTQLHPAPAAAGSAGPPPPTAT